VKQNKASERGQSAARQAVVHLCPLKLRSYWTEVHLILDNVARSSTTNILKSELRYSTPFF